jgi:hypothetical protein
LRKLNTQFWIIVLPMVLVPMLIPCTWLLDDKPLSWLFRMTSEFVGAEKCTM